jgi:magnesium transporter
MERLPAGTIDELLDLIEHRQDAMIRNILPDLHPADVADLLDSLGSDDRAYLFDVLSPAIASEVLPELDQRHREQLVEEMEPAEISEFVGQLSSDDAADIVGELEEPVRKQVLARLGREEAQELRSLLEYKEESAGGIMASEFLALGPTATVEDAIRSIRETAGEIPQVYFLYVLSDDRRLLGVVSLRSLLLARRGATLESLMAPPEVRVPPEMDQEEVARRFRQYDLVEVPVVDAESRMLGVITIDDIVDVIEEEAQEDVARMTGTVDESVVTASVLHAVGRRLPWLLVGLGGGLVSALVISRYEVNIRELVGLAFFVPVITAMGGNVAIQSSSIAVRALAMGEGAYRVMGRRILKEFLASLLNGFVCGAFLGFIAGVWLDAEWMAMLLGAALFAVIIVGTTVGAVVPVVLNRLRIDPALATGPFVTTTNDVLGIVVYLSLASWFLPRFR